MNKRVLLFFFLLMPFAYGLSQVNTFVINGGGAIFLFGPYALGSSNSSSLGLNINGGLKTKYFENGVYYGYNLLRKFEVTSRELRSKSIIPSDQMAGFNTFGAYSNFYITSLFNKKDYFTRIFNFYTTVKSGSYYVPAKDTDFTGVGFNCYFGFGSVFYLSGDTGIFTEAGGDYFSYMDSELNRLSFRIGISKRL